jgi:hypothetical protein
VCVRERERERERERDACKKIIRRTTFVTVLLLLVFKKKKKKKKKTMNSTCFEDTWQFRDWVEGNFFQPNLKEYHIHIVLFWVFS